MLVVEDSRDVAEVTSSLLEQLGYRVVRAENAAEALRHLQQGIGVDLLFSDIVMPGAINGLGLAQICQERFPDIPVLLTSGFSATPRRPPTAASTSCASRSNWPRWSARSTPP